MSSDQDLARYYSTAIELGLYSTEERLSFHLSTLFGDLDFARKSVLDIGGGTGIHSYYAAARGASTVVCLEPEYDGHSDHMNENFREFGRRLGREDIGLEPIPFQEFETRRRFDVVILHDSINHLDEAACVTLLESTASRAVYGAIFQRLADVTTSGGHLVVCDCSRHNLFPLLRLRNPFVPAIEWEKHQAPATWAAMLEDAGFENPRIGWTSPSRLGRLGRIALGNKPAAWLIASHFHLKMDRT